MALTCEQGVGIGEPKEHAASAATHHDAMPPRADGKKEGAGVAALSDPNRVH